MSYAGSWNRSRGRRLVAFFAVMYYAGLRPAETVALREQDCQLPVTGWGRLLLVKTLPVATKKWTDNGTRHDERGLKQRDPDAVRPVPIPPQLVGILRTHLREFGTATDGRLFRNERGGIVGSTTFSRVWEEARALAFQPVQVASPLAGRPYDLRHAALSTWLNAGVSPAEVSRRAGNSVEVLLKRYAGCLDNQEDAVNRRIETAFEESDGQHPLQGPAGGERLVPIAASPLACAGSRLDADLLSLWRCRKDRNVSLAINVDQVSAVLLADGWHDVAEASFSLDSYEYVWYHSAEARENAEPQVLHGGGNSGVCATGFVFKTKDGDYLAGPLTAVVAVRHQPD